MDTISSSKLNPLANTFIPGKDLSNKLNHVEDIAVKMVTELIESKKLNGSNDLSKEELIDVVRRLIVIKYNINPETSDIKSYVSDKLLNRRIFSLKEGNKSFQDVDNLNCDNLDISSSPKFSLLVAFFGLHRHEQSLRPTISFTNRPNSLKDRVWSIDPEDRRIWNQPCVIKACNCPPMFGYSVPPDVFGNPFGISYSCTERNIHLNLYGEIEEGNEHCLHTKEFQQDYDCSAEFSDDFEQSNMKINLDLYSEHMKSIIEEVCNIITADDFQIKRNYSTKDASIPESIWVDASVSNINKSVDEDNSHPLLEQIQSHEEESLTEVEETIRKSLSDMNDTMHQNQPANEICNPPCSVWCKGTTSEKAEMHIKANSMVKSSEVDEDDLNSNSFLTSAHEEIHDTFDETETFSKNKLKPWFKRSFSVNDCEIHCSNADNLKDSLSLRKNSKNSFKKLEREDSWKDTDSGFISQSSSQEDVAFTNRDIEPESPLIQTRFSLLGPFSTDDNLWKPLPDCLPNEQKSKNSHKRARDYKRQTSLN